MAHDFIITDVLDAIDPAGDPFDDLEKMRTGQHADFFGYGDAAMYKAFNAMNFDNGPSGSCDGKVISKAEAVAGLEMAITLLASYPDPKRADDIKRYLRDIVALAPASKRFYIHYS
jgi:hypothetical protein